MKKPRLFGLMLTLNDMPIFARWMARHAALFEKIAVVDGSSDEETAEFCKAYSNVLHRRDPKPPITEQTLRAAAWELIEPHVRRGDWVMLCHPDEFYIHDPRAFLGVWRPVIRWAALHVLPHPSEKEAWAQGDFGGDVTRLFRHYWWKDTGAATLENRMFRISDAPRWAMDDPRITSHALPLNYRSSKHWRHEPAYLHYKIQHLDPEKFSGTKFVDSNLETGLGVSRDIETIDDLFYDEVHPWGHKGFVHCSDDQSFSRFDPFRGRFRLPAVDAGAQ